MTKLCKYLTMLAASAFVACSSMDVSDAESIAENFPKDFTFEEYYALHPVLRSAQLQDTVKRYNDALKNVLSAEEIAADEEAFFADMDQMHTLFVDPRYVGWSESKWELAWAPSEDTVKVVDKIDTVSLKLTSTADSIYTVYAPVQDTAAQTISGFADSAKTEAVTYGLDSLKINGQSIKRDTTYRDSIKVIEGTLTTLNKTWLRKFNLQDRVDDLAYLESIPLDTFAISYQYVVYGQSAGWAYRYCKDDEDLGDLQTSENIDPSKYYCADKSGSVWEIK